MPDDGRPGPPATVAGLRRPGAFVPCAEGMRVALRSAGDGPADLRVGPPRRVILPRSEALEARRADGVVWRRHWSAPERLVIEFVDIAVVEVSAAGIVTFDRVIDGEMEEHLVLDHILPLVLARRGALVIHAAVVGTEVAAMVLVGATGDGKSTLTAYAWQRGWVIGGDDGAVITPGKPCMVEPTYRTIRVAPPSTEMLDIDPVPEATVIGKIRIDRPQEFRQTPVPLRLVAILEPVGENEPARFRPLDGPEAHARLFGSTFHADLSRRRMLPTVMEGLASIIEETRVGYVDVPRGIAGLRAAERVLGDVFAVASGPGT